MKVRARKLPSGLVTWQLDLGVVDGKRVQRSYPSQKAANKALKAAMKAQERHGGMASQLTGGVMAEMILARERLKEAGATLSEAVEFFMKHGGRMREKIAMAELVTRFIEAKQASSARYRRQLRVSLGALARYVGTKQAHEVSQADVESWLEAGQWSAKTQNNYRGDVSACFAWAMKKGHARINPAAEIEKERLGDEEIGTLTVEQCEALLRGAVSQPEMIGFVVLGMFAGLRPAEIQRLDWSAVNLEERTVIVEGKQAKTRRRRVVDLSENAVVWLKAVEESGNQEIQREGQICGSYWDARWRMFRRSLGWAVGSGEKRVKEIVKPGDEAWGKRGEWPHNALRHTFASMHYALHQDETKLQALMGHESAAMLHRHYRALKTAAEARRFWALVPG